MEENKTAILSLCIPIYNREHFLRLQLSRYLEDKELFESEVELIISDNCSQDNLEAICVDFKNQGLNLKYKRQEMNIGPDGNFLWCFQNATGKYVWLLGSDDIPITGLLRKLLVQLKDGEYGWFHINTKKQRRKHPINIYADNSQMIVDVNYMVTFMSSNIIRRESLSTIDLSKYRGTYMIQVPAYINACYYYPSRNIVVDYGQIFEQESDMANNGGYNIFRVFVENLHSIIKEFVLNEKMTNVTFERFKRQEFKEFIVIFVVAFLIFRDKLRKNYDMTDSWNIILNNYANHLYFYYDIIVRMIKVLIKPILRFITCGRFPR